MKFIRLTKELLPLVPLLLLGNAATFLVSCEIAFPLKVLLLGAAFVWYFCICFVPGKRMGGSRKLSALSHGLHGMRLGILSGTLEIVLLIALLCTGQLGFGTALWMCGLDIVFSLVAFGFLFFCSCLWVAGSATQLKWYHYAALVLWWWVPGLNFLILAGIYRAAKKEFLFEKARLELDCGRAENEICRTRYPILMVHGIFFRDWQYFNYWGRIPAALKKNGAVIYYGKQQSSRKIADSAQEVAEQIQRILKETGAEKVNIIAHSKGGLDSRYAISQLGMEPYVASLTTINTPHHGCEWVDDLLAKIPTGIAEWIGKCYEGIFHRLGDEKPEFLAGVRDLTAASAAEFNRQYPLSPNIVHHCVMSEMCSIKAAPFPLWLGYLCNRSKDRSARNDGLVPVESAKLEGVPFTMVKRTRRRGVSHGDMIDLMRENIEDFDVREFYVKLVEELKEKGL